MAHLYAFRDQYVNAWTKGDKNRARGMIFELRPIENDVLSIKSNQILGNQITDNDKANDPR
jgi:hypothetical protein